MHRSVVVTNTTFDKYQEWNLHCKKFCIRKNKRHFFDTQNMGVQYKSALVRQTCQQVIPVLQLV